MANKNLQDSDLKFLFAKEKVYELIFSYTIFPILYNIINGEVYKWKTPIIKTRVFLENIYKDYNFSGLNLALESLKANLEHCERNHNDMQP